MNNPHRPQRLSLFGLIDAIVIITLLALAAGLSETIINWMN